MARGKTPGIRAVQKALKAVWPLYEQFGASLSLRLDVYGGLDVQVCGRTERDCVAAAEALASPSVSVGEVPESKYHVHGTFNGVRTVVCVAEKAWPACKLAQPAPVAATS